MKLRIKALFESSEDQAINKLIGKETDLSECKEVEVIIYKVDAISDVGEGYCQVWSSGSVFMTKMSYSELEKEIDSQNGNI